MTDFGSFELFIYYLFLQSFKLLILQYRIYNVILSINDVSLYCWFDFHIILQVYTQKTLPHLIFINHSDIITFFLLIEAT